MFISKVFLLFFVCLFAVCGKYISETGNTDQNSSNANKENNYFIKMNRSVCFGNCPTYELTVYGDGKVIFDGIKFTKAEGKQETYLSKEKLKILTKEIEKADFYSLKNTYDNQSGNCPAYSFDAPRVVISIKLEEKEKTVLHDLGCEDKSKTIAFVKIYPQQLYNLENKIDEIVETKRWIGEGK